MKESKSGGFLGTLTQPTHFSKRFKKEVAQIPSECIYGGAKQVRGELTAQSSSKNYQPTKYMGQGLIQEAECISDTPGDDSGQLGCTVFFDPIKVQFVNRP